MKLGDLVREYIIETGSMKQMYQRYYALGVSGLRELQMDYSGVPQIATITINSAGVAQLPTNYIRWNRVCIVDGFGVLHALAENNDINLKLKNNDCGVPVKPTGAFVESPFWWQQSTTFYADTTVNGEEVGNLFGLSGGQNAYGNFRIDERSGTIVFNNLFNGLHTFVMEYLGKIAAVDDDYYVHPYEIQAVKDWISWRKIATDRNYTANEKAMAKQTYGASVTTANRRFKNETIGEWLTALRSSNTAVPRW